MKRILRRFVGPVLLLAVLVIGDQIRINRPDHKFRLTLQVETPQGLREAAGIYSVHPDRGYGRGGKTQTKGDALAIEIGERTLVLLLAHRSETGKIDLDDVNYVAVRSFSKAGQRAVFRQMDRLTGAVPVAGPTMPLLAVLAPASDPSSMKLVDADALAAFFGEGVSLKSLSVEIVPNGVWPLDFGGRLGDPVTRSIASRLPSLKQPEGAAVAARAAGLSLPEDADPQALFSRD